MKTISITCLSAVVLLFAACDATKSTTENNNKSEASLAGNLLDGVFVLNTISDKDYFKKSLQLTFNPTESYVHATTECNGITSTYQINGNEISFGPVMATKMYCEGQMDAERELGKALGATTSYTVKNGTLNLIDKEGNVVIVAHKE